MVTEKRKEQLKKANKKWRDAHNDIVKIWRRKWWHKLSPEQKQAVNKKKVEKYWKDPELAREKNNKKHADWVSTEKGNLLNRMRNHKRRAKLKLVTHDFTYDEWQQKLNSVKGVCQKCHRRVGRDNLTVDHIIPINKVEEGFVYGIDDVEPLCSSCNKSKGDKLE